MQLRHASIKMGQSGSITPCGSVLGRGAAAARKGPVAPWLGATMEAGSNTQPGGFPTCSNWLMGQVQTEDLTHPSHRFLLTRAGFLLTSEAQLTSDLGSAV